MLKCSDLMYFFDIDGTLINNIPYDENIIVRNVRLFTSDILLNPNFNDIRWNIITNRPSIDKLFIYLCCIKNGMSPCQIITYNKIFKYYNLNEYGADYKLEIFKNIIDNKIHVKYTKNAVKRIIHVCNNQTENYYINSNRNDYPILSVNTIDFKREFFNHIV